MPACGPSPDPTVERCRAASREPTTMTEHRLPGHAAITAVIAEMEHYDSLWQTELAEYRTADGDIDERRHGAYEHAKDDHAWPVLDALPAWIAALKSATAPADGPRNGPGA